MTHTRTQTDDTFGTFTERIELQRDVNEREKEREGDRVSCIATALSRFRIFR